MTMRSPVVRWALAARIRAAAAAALAAAVAFGAGALWMRHTLYEERMTAAERVAKIQAGDLSAFIALTGIASGDKDACRATEACRSLLPAKTWSTPYAVVTGGVVYGPTVSPMMSDEDAESFREVALRLASAKESPWSVASTSLGPDRSVQVFSWTRSYERSVAPPAEAGDVFTLFEIVGPWEAEAAVGDLDRVLWPGVLAAVLLVGTMAWLVAGNSLDRLERAQDRQRRFIADASHELRSPIASLRTQLEVALAHPSRMDWPAVTADALADVERMAGLADSLLVLARLDGGEPLPDAAVDVAEVARTCVARWRSSARSGLELTCHAGAPAIVAGSATQLGRMLGNLLDNAVRHARSAVTVTVRTAGGAVLVEVTDDGPGVPPADRARVFERFTRLDPGRAREAGGAGLGLPIAREIAIRHGGTLDFAESPRGARLVARLPASAERRG